MSFNIAQTLKQFAKENKGYMLGYFLVSLGSPLAEVLLPHLYGRAVDCISQGAPVTKTFRNITLLWILTQSLYTLMDKLDTVIIPRLQSYIRINIVDNVIKSFEENYQDLELGEITATIIKLPSVVQDLAQQFRQVIIPTTLILITAMGYIFSISRELGIIFLAGLLIFLTAIKFFVSSCMEVSNNFDSAHTQIHETLEDVLSNLVNVYSSGTTAQELQSIENAQIELETMHSKTIDCASKFKKWFNISYLVLFASVNIMAYHLFKQKKIELNSLISVFIVNLYLLDSLKEVSSGIRNIVYNIGVLITTQNYLDELATHINTKKDKATISSIPFEVKSGDIHFKNICLKYNGAADYLFHNLNLHIPSKQRVALMGKIGSGKSTLINLLLRLKPYEGIITIDNIDIATLPIAELRSNISYVSQQPRMFNRSVYDNILYGCKGTKKDVDELLQKFELQSVFGDKNLDDDVGKNGERLSGGQKCVLALLRCFFKNSKILLLDEPTSALNKDMKVYVMKILQNLMRNKTVIIITHDDEILSFVDRCITFDNGKIIQDE